MTERIVVGWVDPGEVSGRFMDSMMRWFYAGQEDVRLGREEHYAITGHVRLETGPRIAPARNAIVRMFLAEERFKEVEWLLMVDADMVFPGNFLQEILRDVRNEAGKITRPVVGGLYFGGGHGAIFPVAYRMVDPETNNGNNVAYVTDFTPGDIISIDACGTGALLMHRGMLEKLAEIHPEPNPLFAESMYQGQEFGEDWTFCMRVRKLGVPIYLNTGARAGHMKSVELNEVVWRTGQVGLMNVAPAPAPEPSSQIILPQGGMNREQRRRLERASR